MVVKDLEWLEPTRVTKVKSFLGLCSFYRKFAKDFTAIAKPLHDLTTKSELNWTDERQAEANSLFWTMIHIRN